MSQPGYSRLLLMLNVFADFLSPSQLVEELNEKCKVYSFFTNSFVPAMEDVSKIVNSVQAPTEVEYKVDHFTDGMTDEQIQGLFESKYQALHQKIVLSEGMTFAILDARSTQDKTVVIWTKLGADDATEDEVNMYPERWESYRVPFALAYEMMEQLDFGNLSLVYGVFTEERKSCIGDDGIYDLLEVYRRHKMVDYSKLERYKRK